MARELDHLPGRLLLDGGMGTSLIGRGLEVGKEPTEGWNVTRSDDVKSVHESFIQAGSQAIQTNTFGANRMRLHAYGRAEDTRLFNVEGVALAREVAGSEVTVIGNLGPTSKIPPPEGDANLLELEYAFAEQAAALAESGVDILHIETLYHPKEARAAVRGCRAGAPDLPVVASMSCAAAVGESFRTTMGFPVESMIAAIVEEGAEGIGANCNLVPADMLDLVRLLIEKSGLPVFAKPTVAPDGGAPLYPEEFATGVTALFAVGARAVGGCCGTGPADIAAASAAIGSAPTSTPPAPTQPYGG